MTRIDYKRELSHLYNASAKEVREIDVPTLTYLSGGWLWRPRNASPAYSEAVEALFSVSYTAKFAIKRSTPSDDYAVMPLEGHVVGANDLSVFESGGRTETRWKWTMMIFQPPMVTSHVIGAAIETSRSKEGSSPP